MESGATATGPIAGPARPFLKWAGGKARLAPEVLALAPAHGGEYHEPFLGGAAVFFALSRTRPPARAYLSDGNAALIACYQAVRDRADEVIDELMALQRDYLAGDPAGRAEYYYGVRAAALGEGPGAAARLIFLNRTAYNGLYRVNSRGEFNVPHGRYRNPRICDVENLHAASAALHCTKLRAEDFETACGRARPGDFVYLDPPYQPLSATSRFTTYTREDFGVAEQVRLRDAFERLTKRGVVAVLSNSDHPVIRDLYEERGYGIRVVQMSRAINSKGNGRAPIGELLIDNRARMGLVSSEDAL